MNIDVRTKVEDLSIAQRQMVEVAKALSVNAKLIVMDEPTSSLTERENAVLMDLVRKLREQGVTVVFISHKLSEIFEISDRVTVLRDGECIDTLMTEECDESQLIQMMVGRSLTDIFPKSKIPIGDKVLEVKNLCAGKQVQDISFELKKGEILGFAGLVGAGRSEVMRAVFGVDRMSSGEIVIDGVNNLSGGNQQKVVIAKWLATHPKVLILDEPTRGIDVGAKKEIYCLMDKLWGQYLHFQELLPV